jgi:ABC-2 type transport system ATP-binding protein
VNGAVVEIAGLTKRYGDRAVVDGVSFSLSAGEVVGFLGPNGAGKSTTLRMLLGLAEPTSGRATILGRRYADLADPAGTVGAVLESDDFHPGRSARDHLRVLAVAAGVPRGRVEEVLGMVDLAEPADQPVRTYSLGMRQRLGLATALLGDPRLLVLDEPINGLDPAGVHWLRGFLRSYADAGGTVLVSSHVLAEVALTVDRVLIITSGRLVADRQVGGIGARDLEGVYLELTSGATT